MCLAKKNAWFMICCNLCFLRLFGRIFVIKQLCLLAFLDFFRSHIMFYPLTLECKVINEGKLLYLRYSPLPWLILYVKMYVSLCVCLSLFPDRRQQNANASPWDHIIAELPSSAIDWKIWKALYSGSSLLFVIVVVVCRNAGYNRLIPF